MHPDPAFRVCDREGLLRFVAARAFAHLFGCDGEGPVLAHAPVTLCEGGHLRFHLSRRNPVTDRLDGARGIASIAGDDFYVSPDWYGLPDQVPTWNYVAAEAHGRFHRLDDAATVAQLDALSDAHEARLAPKPVWTRAKMGMGRFEGMAAGVIGYELRVERWEGTAKLSQNKPAAARAGVAAALAASGRTTHAALIERPAP